MSTLEQQVTTLKKKILAIDVEREVLFQQLTMAGFCILDACPLNTGADGLTEAAKLESHHV